MRTAEGPSAEGYPLVCQPSYKPSLRPTKASALSVLAPKSRLEVLNSVCAADLISLLPTYPTICQVKSPLQDWLNSDLLVIEVPILELGKEETHLAAQRLILKCRSLGLRAMLIVTPRRAPSPRNRRAATSLESADRPIRRWNQWP